MLASAAARAQDTTPGADAADDADAATRNTWFARVAFAPARVIAASDFGSGSDAARASGIASTIIRRTVSGSSPADSITTASSDVRSRSMASTPGRFRCRRAPR